MIYAEAGDMMDRVESYWRMFEVAPPEMQWVLGVAAACTAGVLAKVGWRVSAPLRWAVGRAGVAVSRRVVKAGERGDNIQRLAERIEFLENEVGRRVVQPETRPQFPTDAKVGDHWLDCDGRLWMLCDADPPNWRPMRYRVQQ